VKIYKKIQKEGFFSAPSASTTPHLPPKWAFLGLVGKIMCLAHQVCALPLFERNPMSAPHAAPHDETHDVVEEIVPMMPIVLPVAGAVLMFLLAFIAVFMA
jgi:hypothetical protein